MSALSKKVDRVTQKMRAGARLMKMHKVGGMAWYLVPGDEVPAEVAAEVIKRPDVKENEDGLFPGISQSYRIC